MRLNAQKGQRHQTGRLRVLIVSGVVPSMTHGGGCLALYRHFIDRTDFDTSLIGPELGKTAVIDTLLLRQPRIIARLMQTRFVRLIANLYYVVNWFRVPKYVVEFARQHDPDVILTVPDNRYAGIASQLSRTLAVPIAVNFQDLFPISRFVSPGLRPIAPVRAWLMNKFRRLNDSADVVFYTSKGMQNWFGGSSNGHLLYPVGPKLIVASAGMEPPRVPLKLTYAGNCYGAYGRMLLRLANTLENQDWVVLNIFAVGNDWSAADVQRHTASGIYRDFKPFGELQQEFSDSDAFLCVMSFEITERPFVETSFTTKWLDYAPYSKPVFVWAPAYSTATKFAREFDCAYVIDTDDPNAVTARIKDAASHREQWQMLSRASERIATTELSPDGIHNLLVEELSRVVSRTAASWPKST